MVRDAEPLATQGRDPLAGPEVGLEARGQWSGDHQVHQFVPLPLGKLADSAGMRLGRQRIDAALAPSALPTLDAALVYDAELAEVLDRWATLPEAIPRAVVALVRIGGLVVYARKRQILTRGVGPYLPRRRKFGSDPTRALCDPRGLISVSLRRPALKRPVELEATAPPAARSRSADS